MRNSRGIRNRQTCKLRRHCDYTVQLKQPTTLVCTRITAQSHSHIYHSCNPPVVQHKRHRSAFPGVAACRDAPGLPSGFHACPLVACTEARPRPDSLAYWLWQHQPVRGNSSKPTEQRHGIRWSDWWHEFVTNKQLFIGALMLHLAYMITAWHLTHRMYPGAAAYWHHTPFG